ncbi:Magnesium transport protein CorA [Chlamydiales bacterium STE3]|nr:Magnesium transport protein CorA [Chlamydiales bacterium STE3]
MMSRFLRKRARKIGVPPGTLFYTGDSIEKKLNMTVVEYDNDKITKKHNPMSATGLDYLRAHKNTWINVCGINNAAKIAEIGQGFKLHSLLLEDVMNPVQRSKVEDYKDYIFVVTRLLSYNKEKGTIEDEQFSFILGPNYLISFVEKENAFLKALYERLEVPNNRIRRSGVDYLAYSLLDAIVDSYFLILETIDNQLEGLEEDVLNSPKISTLSEIQQAKGEMALLRKSIWPMREVINQLRKTDSSLISNATKLFFYDVYDHIVQEIETIEGFRDIVSGMLDIYMSNINQRTNEIMKVLTVITTIFVPLTFIASLYGMNFSHMPGLESTWGFSLTLIAMLLSVAIMFFFFRKRHWI